MSGSGFEIERWIEAHLDDEGGLPIPCLHQLAASSRGVLGGGPLPGAEEPEGPRVPDDLPRVIDAHVHLFDAPIFRAIWRWFEEHAWPVRYKLETPEVIAFLLGRGVSRIVALHYAHKPGMARAMNAYMAEVVRREPRVLGLATVLPGEEGAREILEEAFDLGLRGVKLHCHVQCFAPDDDALGEVFEACSARGLPLVMHAGREPKSPAYRCDPHALCGVERVERVLAEHPRLKLVVPHLGADEFAPYARLVERHDNLWLDTTMMLASYFEVEDPTPYLFARPDRLLYGTDFPNLPYAWDRELGRLARVGLDDDALERVLSRNAEELYGLVEEEP